MASSITARIHWPADTQALLLDPIVRRTQRQCNSVIRAGVFGLCTPRGTVKQSSAGKHHVLAVIPCQAARCAGIRAERK